MNQTTNADYSQKFIDNANEHLDGGTHGGKASDSLQPRILEYLRHVSLRESDVMKRLRDETGKLPLGMMQIPPEQGQLIALLVRLMNAGRIIEIGVFTGYSTICLALALPENGTLVACDVNEEWTAIAQRYWKEMGVDHKIDLHLAPAIQTLDTLIAEGNAGTYDFAFIDADKPNYENYFEKCLALIRPGGLITIDNVLWHGSVADPANQEPDTVAIRNFNTKLHDDIRISLCLVPIGDGLTLAMKR